MTAARFHTPHFTSRHKSFLTISMLVLAQAVLAIGLLTQTSVSEAAAPVAQCNNDAASNVGGQGIACTVTIVNYVTSTGTFSNTLPSTVTVTVCAGAAGPISAGAGTCTTTTTTSTEPITQVQQCNGSGNGGGGVVICAATITNHFGGAPTVAATPAAIYQGIGSVITGTGAPGTLSPVNTPGITSVTAATVGQCNGSGNGGTSVAFTCTVTPGSTMTSTLAVNIDQCNGSANGGGALVTCMATVTNDVVAAPPTPVPAAVVTPAPVPTTVPAAGVTATPVLPAPVVPPAVVVTPPPAIVTPPAVVTPPTTPRPPATGNAGLARDAGTPRAVALLLAIATVGLVLVGRRLVSGQGTR